MKPQFYTYKGKPYFGTDTFDRKLIGGIEPYFVVKDEEGWKHIFLYSDKIEKILEEENDWYQEGVDTDAWVEAIIPDDVTNPYFKNET